MIEAMPSSERRDRSYPSRPVGLDGIVPIDRIFYALGDVSSLRRADPAVICVLDVGRATATVEEAIDPPRNASFVVSDVGQPVGGANRNAVRSGSAA